ncbi:MULTISPECIES: LuxR C-terminal-related transcriptional regulator [unclassified Microbacterium]|uniref:LuxR C-terminal-related transcriptional regulator n=1 Tax=unclassified Microbacterium TaxID=2609290 RepID=UPI00109CA558|nr:MULTISPECIES: LuxR C-terminal-related transcriptional regulator [unclassified Microbacterium]
MFGNQVTLTDAVAYIRARVDVAVYGRPGSGRTTFLRRLQEVLRESGYTVLLLAGSPGLQRVPLGGLSAFFGEPASVSRLPDVGSYAQRLAKEAANGDFVLFIDDADHLDDASWGVIRAVQHSALFPVVTTHRRVKEVLQGARNPHLGRAYQLWMQPLRLDELEALLKHRADAAIDPATLSRIFGKSGGLAGLAIGIWEVGIQEGQLALNDGVWSAQGELWSPTLGRLVERHIGPLRRREREALERLSLGGPLDLDSTVALLGGPLVEKLEEKALLTFELVNGEQRSAVAPPLIAEYFRHLALPARAARLARGTDGLAVIESRASSVTDVTDLRAAQPDAMFVRAVQDAARARLLRSRAEWEQGPSAENAFSYLLALAAADLAPREVRSILSRTVHSDDMMPTIRLLGWHAAWLAGRGNLAQAKELLRDAEKRAGQYRPALQAARVRLEVLYEGHIGDIRDDVAPPDGLPDNVRGSVHVIRAAGLLISGQILAAEEELAQVDPHSLGADWADHETIRGMVRLAKGEHAQATLLAYSALEQARASADATAIRTTAYFAALCQLIRGNYREATTLVETALAVGTPSSNAPTSLLGALCIGSIVAGRTGSAGLAQTRLDQAERLIISDGPFPAMSTSWPQSQIQLAAGRPDSARQELRQGAERLWRRGARWNAVLEHLIELELWPDPGRFEELRPRLDAVEGEFVAALRAYVEALVAENSTQLEESAPRLLRTGRPGFAVNAYDRAAQLFEDAGHAEDAERVRRAGDDLIASLDPGTFDAARFRSADILLTKREIQLARLAAMGWSNQQIATELVLSVRTVESHLHRIMKKTGTTSRRDLGPYLPRN